DAPRVLRRRIYSAVQAGRGRRLSDRGPGRGGVKGRARGSHGVLRGREGGEGVMIRVAYADPPYPGQAKKHYGSEEVCHRELITRLTDEYPDGWALSTSSPSLTALLPLCPPGCRVGAWVKPFCVYKPGVNPAYAWEPVIWRGG